MDNFYKNETNNERGSSDDQKRIKHATVAFLRMGLVFFALAGFLYFYGMHNAFFYSRTPVWIQQQPIESTIDSEEILQVPITIFILDNNETNGSQRSPEDVERMVEKASHIWQQANIELYVEDIFIVERSDEDIDMMMSSPVRFVRTFDDLNRRTVNTFLVGRIEGINGVAFLGLQSIAVADYTTSHDFRVLAHEVGHMLGLPHVEDKRLLMYTGASGSELSLSEVGEAREAAIRNFENVHP